MCLVQAFTNYEEIGVITNACYLARIFLNESMFIGMYESMI